jgi:hypothetical protein
MIKRSLLLLPMLIAAQAVDAGQAEICYATPVPFASFAPPTNATVFVCPVSGSKTLPQLAVLGWDVVQMGPLTSDSNGGPGSTHITEQLVIQKK